MTLESLISDDFDREFRLADLLPIKEIHDILGPLDSLFHFEVINADRSIHYSLQPQRNKKIEIWAEEFFSLGLSKILPSGHWHNQKASYALNHEGAPIGYLLVVIQDQAVVSRDSAGSFATMIAATLNQIIRLNSQIKMISGLQSQVVEDSYTQLQAKAEALAVSEKKYRLLAESLEDEVKKKSRTIQQAIVKMAQQEKMASVGQLAAGVAHEINNPMGFIISNLNTLKNHSGDLERFIDSCNYMVSQQIDNSAPLDRIVKDLYQKLEIDYVLSDVKAIIEESIEGAERIRKIVSDLKEFANPGRKDAIQVNLNDLVKTTLNIGRSQIGAQIQLETDFAPLPPIIVNAQEINQVVLNILLNAVQAMEGQGIIQITTRAMDNKVELSIVDNGCGIAENNLSKIFDPFFTTKDVGSGTGLGLTFAHNVVRQHNGSISVESKLNAGSRFTICLPCIGS